MRLPTALRRVVRRAYVAFGGMYFRVAAVGGSAAVVFLAVWPLSTMVVVGLVAVVAPAVTRTRRHRSTAR